MKKIEAIIKPFKLDEVKEALSGLDTQMKKRVPGEQESDYKGSYWPNGLKFDLGSQCAPIGTYNDIN